MIATTKTPTGHPITYSYNSGRFLFDGRELHCGDCFELLLAESTSGSIQCWIPVRIEHNETLGWFLITPVGRLTSFGGQLARRAGS